MLEKILEKEILNKEEIVNLLEINDRSLTDELFSHANELRNYVFGNNVELRGVIEFSNYCENSCNYCGLREDNYSIERYRMTADEIIDTAKTIMNLGVHTIVLQSGTDFYFDTDMISYLIYSIKNITGSSLTLSLGQRKFSEYKAWKIAGADNYYLKHETSNSLLYENLHTLNPFEEKIEHLKYLKKIGYKIGTGSLIGLPDQSIEDIAEDIILARNIDADMVAFTPFIPAPFTPLADELPGTVDLTLRAMAIARIVLRDVHIPATMALDTLDKYGREKGLNAGANMIMPNFTPNPYRDKYEVYPTHRRKEKDPVNVGAKMQFRIEAIGKKVSQNSKD